MKPDVALPEKFRHLGWEEIAAQLLAAPYTPDVEIARALNTNSTKVGRVRHAMEEDKAAFPEFPVATSRRTRDGGRVWSRREKRQAMGNKPAYAAWPYRECYSQSGMSRLDLRISREPWKPSSMRPGDDADLLILSDARLMWPFEKFATLVQLLKPDGVLMAVLSPADLDVHVLASTRRDESSELANVMCSFGFQHKGIAQVAVHGTDGQNTEFRYGRRGTWKWHAVVAYSQRPELVTRLAAKKLNIAARAGIDDEFAALLCLFSVVLEDREDVNDYTVVDPHVQSGASSFATLATGARFIGRVPTARLAADVRRDMSRAWKQIGG